MALVKICGITTLDDALYAAEQGADMIGLNFFKKSPRYIDPEEAATLCDTLRNQLGDKTPVLIGVFVNEIVGNVSAVTSKVGLDAAQMSGDESDNMIKELRGMAYKAIQPMTVAMALDDVKYFAPHFPERAELPSISLDAYHPNLKGGTGESVSVEMAQAVKAEVPRLMLAGGLTPENVGDRVKAIEPFAVDVASGVEGDTPGVKDHAKIRDFIQAAKQ